MNLWVFLCLCFGYCFFFFFLIKFLFGYLFDWYFGFRIVKVLVIGIYGFELGMRTGLFKFLKSGIFIRLSCR